MSVIPITAAKGKRGGLPHPASMLDRLTSYLTLQRIAFDLSKKGKRYKAPEGIWLGAPAEQIPRVSGLARVTVKLTAANVREHLMVAPSTGTLAEVYQLIRGKTFPPLITQELKLTDATLRRFAEPGSAAESSLGVIEEFLYASLSTPVELPLSIYFEDGEPGFMVGLTAEWIFRNFMLEAQNEHTILRRGEYFIADFYMLNTDGGPVFRIIQRIPRENIIISVSVEKIGRARPVILGKIFDVKNGDYAAEQRSGHSIDDLTKAEILAYQPAVMGILAKEGPLQRNTSPAARRAIGARRGQAIRPTESRFRGPDGESQVVGSFPPHEVLRIQSVFAQGAESKILILESARTLLEILRGIGALPKS